MGENGKFSRREFMKMAGATGAALWASGAASVLRPSRAFAQEEITVAVHAVPHATAVYNFRDQFEEEYGIKVNVVEMAPEAIFEKTMTELIGHSGAFDVIQFMPSWIADTSVHLEPLGPLAEELGLDFKLDDVVASFREIYTTWGGVWYAMTWDGDCNIFYYNTLAFDNEDYQKKFEDEYGYPLGVPKTWLEYLDVAKFFTGWDWDEDGEDEYGCAEYLGRGRMYWWFLDRFASMGGVYFDEDMTPLINTQAGLMALENMIAAVEYMPPGGLAYTYMELHLAITNGDVAMGKQWTNVGKAAALDDESKVKGVIGYDLVPGWELKEGEINYRPMLAGGWNLGIPKDSTRKEAAAKFIHFITSPEISLPITMAPDTGLDPYRISHYESPEFQALWPEAKEYLQAINDTLAIGFPELQIPGAAEYMDVLDLELTEALAGNKDPEEALNSAADQWNEITDRLGLETQKEEWGKEYDAMKGLGIVYTPMEE